MTWITLPVHGPCAPKAGAPAVRDAPELSPTKWGKVPPSDRRELGGRGHAQREMFM